MYTGLYMWTLPICKNLDFHLLLAVEDQVKSDDREAGRGKKEAMGLRYLLFFRTLNIV